MVEYYIQGSPSILRHTFVVSYKLIVTVNQVIVFLSKGNQGSVVRKKDMKEENKKRKERRRGASWKTESVNTTSSSSNTLTLVDVEPGLITNIFILR